MCDITVFVNMVPLPSMLSIAFHCAGFVILAIVWYITDPEHHIVSYKNKLFVRDKTKTAYLVLILFMMNILAGLMFPWAETRLTPVISAISAAIFSIGLFLSIWAKLAMRTNWGTPAQHNPDTQTRLVVHGPYRYTRNPIYLGLIIMLIFSGIGMKSFLFPAALLFVLHVRWIIHTEERLLDRYFGKKYAAYRQTVPRYF